MLFSFQDLCRMEGPKVLDCSYCALGMIQGTWYSFLVPGHCLKSSFWQKSQKETCQQLCEQLSQCPGSVYCSGINSLLLQVSVLKVKQACYALNVKDRTCCFTMWGFPEHNCEAQCASFHCALFLCCFPTGQVLVSVGVRAATTLLLEVSRLFSLNTQVF